jgi:hypothetical protein
VHRRIRAENRRPVSGGHAGEIVPERPARELDQGVSRERPLARRALITLRPLRVAIRARKPWVRALLSRLGWKVRFILVPVKSEEVVGTRTTVKKKDAIC